ncbi:MAG: glycosyltransferase family 2 protein [Verrucomicrobiales bacterium]|nr:glycosyltransferase family 2 protein [Verrucomicrobiales bacterium]
MRFSVIIAARNAVKTLGATLDSISNQEFQDHEVILIDDASTDSSSQLAEQHAINVHIVNLPCSIGPGAARNYGATLACGDYLTFLDADDFWFPWTLSSINEAIRVQTNACFFAGKAVRGDIHPHDASNFRDTLGISYFQDYLESASDHLWIGVGGVAIERQTFSRVGGFAEWQENSEDSDLWLRLGKSPGFVEINSPPLFYYRQLDTGLTSRPDRIAKGYMHLIKNELAGNYPGGADSRINRLKMLTRHTRSASLELLRLGRIDEAFDLYLSTFFWNFRLFRFKYLFGFWGMAALRFVFPGTGG